MISIKKTTFHHLFITFLCLQCNKLNTMNHVIQFPTNNCTAPHQILMQNIPLIATATERIPNTNIPLYLYNQLINNFNQNTEPGIKTEKNYNCPQCPKKFVYKQSLINHGATHTYREPYACIYCEKKYSQKKTLTVHIKTKHEEKKTYITHTDKQIYACIYCEKKYALKNSLSVHIKIKHREKKTHTNFIKTSNLTQTHTEKKSYTCELCDKKYTSASFVEHVKNCYKKTYLQSCKDADSLLINMSEILHSPHQEPLENELFSAWDENI